MTVTAPPPIRFTVTADDVVDATRAYAGHRQRSGMIVGAVLLGAGILAFLMTSDPLWFVLSVIGVVGLAAPFLRAIDRSLARANPQTRLGEECTMEFDQDGLRFDQGAVSGTIRWTDVSEIRDGENAILVLKDRALLASIPKRAFSNPGELDAARAFLFSMVAHP